MVTEFTGAVDEVEPDWSDRPDDEQDVATRIVRAVDAFGQDAKARERARTVGLGRVLVLAVGLVLLLAIGMTVHDLINGAVAGIDRGL